MMHITNFVQQFFFYIFIKLSAACQINKIKLNEIPASQASTYFQDFHPHHFACIDVSHENVVYRTKDLKIWL